MLRKQGEVVAQAFHDLVLGEVAGESEVRTLKSRSHELGAGEIRAVEQSVAQIGVGEIGAVEPGIGQIGAGQVGAGEVRAGKRGEAERAPRSRAEARLTGPPFMMPICRSAALKESLKRSGTVAGFCRRQSFHDRGPRRKTSTCSESANTVSGRKWRKMAPVFAEGGYLDCVTPP